MTDEEKAEEYVIGKAHEHYHFLFEENNGSPVDFAKLCYLDGLTEGKKEKECNCITYFSFKDLEKENAELQKDKEWLDNTNNEQTKVILELQEQIEKMKCCQNCKKRRTCIKHNNFIYPEMTNPINYGCDNLSKWELKE